MTAHAPVDSDLMERLRPHIEMAQAVEAQMREESKVPPRVYFIRAGEAVKIGVARDPKRRMRELQVGNHERLELLATVSGGSEREKRLHREFSVYALGGEWFRFEGYLKTYVEMIQSRGRRR